MSGANMTWRGDELKKAMRAALGKANYDNAADLAMLAADDAPVESGDLRGSINPFQDYGGNGKEFTRFQSEAGGLNMTVGSDLPYAAVQHEDLSLNHDGPEVPGGKAKYLEDPLNANRDRYMQHLADAAAEVLGG